MGMIHNIDLKSINELTIITENNDKTLIEQLIIPQANDYLIEYTVNGSCTFEEEYESTGTLPCHYCYEEHAFPHFLI